MFNGAKLAGIGTL